MLPLIYSSHKINRMFSYFLNDPRDLYLHNEELWWGGDCGLGLKSLMGFCGDWSAHIHIHSHSEAPSFCSVTVALRTRCVIVEPACFQSSFTDRE